MSKSGKAPLVFWVGLALSLRITFFNRNPSSNLQINREDGKPTKNVVGVGGGGEPPPRKWMGVLGGTSALPRTHVLTNL